LIQDGYNITVAYGTVNKNKRRPGQNGKHISAIEINISAGEDELTRKVPTISEGGTDDTWNTLYRRKE
jgi:hypothetical protein